MGYGSAHSFVNVSISCQLPTIAKYQSSSFQAHGFSLNVAYGNISVSHNIFMQHLVPFAIGVKTMSLIMQRFHAISDHSTANEDHS